MTKTQAFVVALVMLGVTGTVLSARQAPCSLNFPDVSGKIVAHEKDYIIRMIGSGPSAAKTVQARFYVRADRQSCWRVITDYDHYPEFMPQIASAKRVANPNGLDTYAFTLKVAVFTVSYTLEMKGLQPVGPWTLSWNYVKGDLKSTSGSWEIFECPETPGVVLVSYNVQVDVGALVPAFVSNHLTTGSIPKLIEAVRLRAEGRTSVSKR
jgi:ribosome-associated toxin RatA of RatAB toxin-antitoxin module